MPYFNYDNTSLYYEVKGNQESKQGIVFFNGVMASVSSWYDLASIFEKSDFKIVLHDFKGQLKSDKPLGPYSFESHCQEAYALFKELHLEKVHIVGTSYGGEVAMKFAMMYPEFTKSIVVIDSVSETDMLMEGFISGWKNLCDLNDGEKFFWGMMPTIYGKSFIEANYTNLRERAIVMQNIDSSYFEGQKILYDSFLSNVNFTGDLHKIQCPALIICGDKDILKPPHYSKIIANGISNSEYVILEDCGHVAIFEKPDILKTLLMGFVYKNI